MTTQPSPPNCPDCGTQLPADSPQSLCPACLLRQALASRTVVDADPKPSSPPPSPEEIADKFPQFEITECLGRGGMGVVYKARQKSLNRWVAIKILAPERVGDEKFAERFSREAQTLALLNHPNIVTVYDYGETDGLYYIVMEFVDGINLRDLLRDGHLDPKQALGIIPPVCEALQFAHDKGIVHRDIKPENLLLDREGRIKIADFGIAAMVGATGETSGTPPYMAPEQGGANTNVDHRVDIYALGAVLYETLTGERPDGAFQAPSQKVQIDIRIDDIVLRALNKEPERRYNTADQFRTMVETVASTSAPVAPSTTPPAPSNSSKPLDPIWKKIAGIALIVLGAISLASTAISILILPLAFSSGSSLPLFQSPYAEDFYEMQKANFGIPPLAYILIGAGILLSITLSVLTILGGRQIQRDATKPMALVGAIACCFISFLWPLGLIVGIFAMIILVMEKGAATATAGPATATVPNTPAKPDGPKISGMAITAAILTFLGFGGIFLLILAANFISLPTPQGGLSSRGPDIRLSFGALLTVVIPLFTFLPGAILGWIAAKNIRESNGKLTGIGLAKFAALFPLIILGLLFVALFIRLINGVLFFENAFADNATLLIVGLLAALTAFTLLFNALRRCSRHLSGTPKPARTKAKWIFLTALLTLWIGAGILVWIQRPHQVHAPLSLHSPDKKYSAHAFTEQRMRVFDSDLLTYRFNIIGKGGTIDRNWEIRIPVELLATNAATVRSSDFHFAEHGKIQWTPDSKSVLFLVNNTPVFSIAEDQNGNMRETPTAPPLKPEAEAE